MTDNVCGNLPLSIAIHILLSLDHDHHVTLALESSWQPVNKQKQCKMTAKYSSNSTVQTELTSILKQTYLNPLVVSMKIYQYGE